jgi:hypothetical protein
MRYFSMSLGFYWGRIGCLAMAIEVRSFSAKYGISVLLPDLDSLVVPSPLEILPLRLFLTLLHLCQL